MRLPNTVEKGDRITAAEYAALRGVSFKVLLRAIDAGLVRAELVPTGKRLSRLVDIHEADEDWANLPRCPRDGCNEPAVPPSLACNGPHARGIEEKDKKKPAETCRKMSAAKKGKPRPDVRARVEAMHADSKQHAEWGLALMEGRAKRSATIPANTTMKKWKNRVNGHEGGRQRLDAQPEYQETLDKIVAAYHETHASQRDLERQFKVSRRMVRIALGRPL